MPREWSVLEMTRGGVLCSLAAAHRRFWMARSHSVSSASSGTKPSSAHECRSVHRL